VLAVSPPLAAWARRRGATTAEVVPNGVDLDRFDPDRQRPQTVALRRQLGLEGAVVMGFAGSLKPWHGVEVLLAAAASLATSRPALRVLVVGDGPGRPDLERRSAEDDHLADRVVFTGTVNPALVPAYLGVFDVATAPFLPAEDFYFSPLKVVEAMAGGRPTVASRLAPIEAMLGSTGVLVPPGDPAALARAIDELLADPSKAARLGEAARRRAMDGHGWDKVAARILGSAARARSASPVGA
ncbi:MAG: glycosyltransferase family 4 protein, partial [Acidimicrobiales bacterium]